MINRNNDLGNDAETAAIKALAAASKTPFWTAFKVTMGVAVAQLLVLGIVLLTGTTVLGTVVYLLVRK